jgi:hypothetical protein
MIPGIEFDFGGGRRYVVPPLALGDLELYQERIAAIQGLQMLDPVAVKTVLDVTHAALSRNYPEMTRDQVGQLIDVGNMDEVLACVLDAGGIKRKMLAAGGEQGNAPAPAFPPLEAGAPSTPA